MSQMPKNHTGTIKTIHALTLDECDKLLTTLIRETPSIKRTNKGLRNYTMALIMLDAGLRVGEVSKLLVTDLIINEGAVTSLCVSKEIAKKRRERTIPVSQRLRQAINHMWKVIWSAQHPSSILYAFDSLASSAPLSPRQIQRIIKQAAIRSIGRPTHPHALRHTFASRLMRTTNIRIVQQLLGHASIQSTQIYTHPNSSDLAKAIESMEKGASNASVPGN